MSVSGDLSSDFRQQLLDVEEHAIETSREYYELSPEGRRECREHLDKTAKTLLKIQKELMDAEKADLDPDSRVVQVLGISENRGVRSSDFRRSFEASHVNMRNHEKDLMWIPGHFKVTNEYNYELDKDFKFKPAVEQIFLTFDHVKDAYHALSLKNFHMTIKGIVGVPVKFVNPAQNSGTRETFRKIGCLVYRVKEIEEELKSLGAVSEYGRPKPPPTFFDKAYFGEMLPQWKRVRAAGQALDHHAFMPLKCRKPVDMKSLQARLDALYNEECDALIQLREFQLNGIEFEF